MSYSGRFILSQLLEMVHRQTFARCVERYDGDYKVRQFTCRAQFICMAFAQLTGRESLRDIETCLNAIPSRLYHLGLPGLIARSTLAEANETRSWKIYADIAAALIPKARALYMGEELGVSLSNAIYALDSTTIDLCLTLFPWARFRRSKAAIKLHTLLNVKGSIPECIYLSDGKTPDVTMLDSFELEAGSFYIMDRGYLDWERLYAVDQVQAFFVTRAKSNMRFRRITSEPVDQESGLICDQTIELLLVRSRKAYPARLRRVRYKDRDTGQVYVFITNNFDIPAIVVAQLYKMRWRVELFFKWIKGRLRVKTFYGTSKNAVLTQIWIGMCVYLIVAIIKKEMKIPASLYTMLQILETNCFSQVSLKELLTKIEETANSNQINLPLDFNDL